MKIAIVGGGASGLIEAIAIKRKHLDFDVVIIERNETLGKKLLVTGNGKCNLCNLNPNNGHYKNEEFALPIINKYTPDAIISLFSSLGVPTKNVGDLIYPISESSATVLNGIEKEINKLGIKIIHNQLISYKVNKDSISLSLINQELEVDKLIISCGGKAYPQLGTDGNLVSELIKHKYNLTPYHPALCPIKVKENVRKLDGCRSKVVATLYQDNKKVYQEEGELLFKKDGLSGIVIFNLSSQIAHLSSLVGVNVVIDFIPLLNEDLSSLDYKKKNEIINSYIQPKIASWLIGNHISNPKAVSFTFTDFSYYEYAQVTSGGVSVKDLTSCLESKIEKNVYFIGEVVDVDGLCGGYNLSWAFSSALLVSDNI